MIFLLVRAIVAGCEGAEGVETLFPPIEGYELPVMKFGFNNTI